MRVIVHGFQVLLAIIILTAAGGGFTAQAKEPRKPNFALFYEAAKLSALAYEPRTKIMRQYRPGMVWVNTPGTSDVQYVLITDDDNKRQIIAVRGTVDDANWKLDRDTRAVRDQRGGLLLHRGFKRAAEDIYGDVRPRLKPGYTLFMTGHSLGGAVAVILGIYMWDDGFRVGGIITLGQPKFTSVEGARAYAALPIIRLVYQNDVVSLLPEEASNSKQQFVHIGAVINLLSGPYYTYGSMEQAIQFDLQPLSKVLLQVSVPDHMIKWYLQSLREKKDQAIQVRNKDRNRYIERHKFGSGVDTVKPQKRYNFNSR